MDNFCFVDEKAALKSVGSSLSGLSCEEASRRLLTNGKNVLEKGKKVSVVGLFFSQFGDFMTILLIAAACISGIISYISRDKSDLFDTVIILFIIFLNAVVGTIQSVRADKAIEKLKKMSASQVKLRRDGKVVVVPSDEVVVGDVVIFEEGDVVPCDVRLLSASEMLCDQSALTGESLGVKKSPERIRKNKISLADTSNMLYGSTYVVRGSGEGVAVKTGMDTEIGKIAALLNESKKDKSPLERSLDKLGKIVSIVVILVTVLIFIIGTATGGGVLDNFMTAVAVAVAAIPEGLPAVVTVIMAMGVQKMSREKVVVRKLKSVETLGSCSVICSDKTGTLTKNKLKVKGASALQNRRSLGDIRGSMPKLDECISACNSVKGRENMVGDPTEIALLEWGGSEREFSELKRIPFTSERKMMSVAADFGGDKNIYSKGACDVLVAKCTHALIKGEIYPLTADLRRQILLTADKMSDDALRVLAFAYKPFYGTMEEDGLVFLAVLGLSDELKEGAAEAVAECKKAGISTVMITGDHARTAFAMAREIGIVESLDEVICGDELENMSPKQRVEAARKCKVFARVMPKHKKLIVSAFKADNKVVAMTGDGVNDAPSIKAADIGIAMGSGTEVAKNAADMVISDDNFSTIVVAVKEGRRISENVKKTIRFFIATNLGEVLAILFASIFFIGREFLLSTQLLWLNLITDSLPVLALGAERADDDIMSRPPQKCEEGLFSKQSLLTMLFYGVFISAVSVGLFAVSLNIWGNQTATTMTFMCMSFLELMHGFNVKSSSKSVFANGFRGNKLLLLTIGAGIVLNTVLMLTPLKFAFGLTDLNAVQWLIVATLSLSSLFVGELFKALSRRFGKGGKRSRLLAPHFKRA